MTVTSPGRGANYDSELILLCFPGVDGKLGVEQGIKHIIFIEE
jgi:hypothetical protein